jgi:hypothetical protein
MRSFSWDDPNPFHQSADGHAVTVVAFVTGGGGGFGDDGLGGGPARVVAMASVACAAAADSSGVCVVSTLHPVGAAMSGRL